MGLCDQFKQDVKSLAYLFSGKDKTSLLGWSVCVSLMLLYIKGIMIFLLILLGCVCLSMSHFRRHLQPLYQQPLAAVILFWCAWCVVSVIINPSPWGHSWVKILKEFEVFFWPCLLIMLPKSISQRRAIFGLLLLSILLADVVMIVVKHIAVLPGHAAYLSWLNALFIALCWHQRSLPEQEVWLLDFASLGMMIYLFISNTQRVGVLVLGCMALYHVWRCHRSYLTSIYFWLLVSVGVTCVLMGTAVGQRFFEMVYDIKDYFLTHNIASPAGGRLAFYEPVIDVMRKWPILGLGMGGFKGFYYQTEIGQYAATVHGIVRHPHNSFLTILVEHGLVGLGFFIGVLVSLWRLPYRDGIAARIVLGSFVVGSLVDCFWTGELTRASVFILLSLYVLEEQQEGGPRVQSDH